LKPAWTSSLHNINNHQHEVNLVLKDLAPRVTDTTTAAELGITELVVQETSYFYGSEAARIQNIQVGSSTFDGILIAPGEVFSMAKYMTNISLDNGYAEAIIIVGDQSVRRRRRGNLPGQHHAFQNRLLWWLSYY